MKKVLGFVLGLMASSTAFSAPGYLTGNIVNFTSVTEGILIMLDSGVPDNCAGTAYNWMMIKETNKAMTSVAIAAWAAGKKKVTVYTNPRGTDAICSVIQYHPQ